MTIEAKFIEGPLSGETRALQRTDQFIKVAAVESPKHATPDTPSEFVSIKHHVYELDAVRLVLGDETVVFYHYIGLADQGELL